MAGRETILVVEDAEEIRSMVCGMLVSEGYNCLAAADGVDALRLLEGGPERVHLVLTDMVMPRMMGAELARRVARLDPGIRIMVMSGFCEGALARLFEDEASVFIAKPFTAAALYAKVRQALDQPWQGLPDLDPAPPQP